MKTIREYIIEAEAQGYDVAIEDKEGVWEHNLSGNGWNHIIDYWYEEEHAFDECAVIGTEVWQEEKMFVIKVER